MTDFLERNCPLCSSPPPARAEVVSRPCAENLDFNELIPSWNGIFKRRVFFSYARCAVCGLLFAPRFFDLGQLAALYSQMPPNMSEVPRDALERTYRRYFEALRAHSDLRGGFVEIGPDIGLLAQECAREGRFDAFWMFEPNIAVVGELKARLVAVKPTVINSMADFSAIPPRSAGAAVLIQVLDHLLDPLATLRDLRAKLRDDGVLLIVTHDEASPLRRALGFRWPPFGLQHPQLYNRRSITALVRAAGYDVITIEGAPNDFTLQFLVKSLLWAFGLKVRRAPAFASLTLTLQLGNIITLARPAARNSAAGTRAVGAEAALAHTAVVALP